MIRTDTDANGTQYGHWVTLWGIFDRVVGREPTFKEASELSPVIQSRTWDGVEEVVRANAAAGKYGVNQSMVAGVTPAGVNVLGVALSPMALLAIAVAVYFLFIKKD